MSVGVGSQHVILIRFILLILILFIVLLIPPIFILRIIPILRRWEIASIASSTSLVLFVFIVIVVVIVDRNASIALSACNGRSYAERLANGMRNNAHFLVNFVHHRVIVQSQEERQKRHQHIDGKQPPTEPEEAIAGLVQSDQDEPHQHAEYVDRQRGDGQHADPRHILDDLLFLLRLALFAASSAHRLVVDERGISRLGHRTQHDAEEDDDAETEPNVRGKRDHHARDQPLVVGRADVVVSMELVDPHTHHHDADEPEQEQHAVCRVLHRSVEMVRGARDEVVQFQHV
mmetsp:Transcript_53660/g.85766  ORF Transcript_53660/g.85766 Transcript_53660/m.85766 type:complete len:289 (+) Transcript_53660:72-938(+)